MPLLKKKNRYAPDRVLALPISQIRANPAQPRTHFDESSLQELAVSIQRYGILQPLTVRALDGGAFELIAGERRLRAARIAGLTEVPCIVAAVSAQDSSLLALIENIQRRDLNYMEEAAALQKLMLTYGLSQEKLAEQLGKSQSAVANKLRLLKLSPECAAFLLDHKLTERHARALLRIPDELQRRAVLDTIAARGLNVAQTESYIESLLQQTEPKVKPRKPTFIVKDVRLFLNAVNHSMDIVRRSGLDATCEQTETEDTILLTIRLPKRGKSRPARV